MVNFIALFFGLFINKYLYFEDISQRSSRIEDFPGEIWFELFSYFNGQSLLNNFSQLNSSIESYLNDYRLPIHWNISTSNFLCPSLFNVNQIVSLTLDYSNIESDEFIDIQSFVRLRSLRLLLINEEQLEKLSQCRLNDLYQVSIRSKCARFLIKILLIYFPHVYRMELNSMKKEFLIKSFDYPSNKTQITNLVLHGTIKLAKLFCLWSFVPNLRSLSVINGGIHQCDYWIDDCHISPEEFPLNLCYLHLNIHDDDMTFVNLERLIPKSVRRVKITGSMADDDFEDYICSTNWIRLMSKCSNNLQRIYLDISSYYDPSDSSGLQKTLANFRRNAFFRHTKIQSKNFFITIKGYIQPDQQC